MQNFLQLSIYLNIYLNIQYLLLLYVLTMHSTPGVVAASPVVQWFNVQIKPLALIIGNGAAHDFHTVMQADPSQYIVL